MRLLLSLSVVLFCFSSFAQDEGCGRVRLDEEPGCVAGTPVTNQGGERSCYVHTAATVLTCLNHLKDGRRGAVSPEKIWTEIRSLPEAQLRKVESATSGRTCNAVQLAEAQGTCDRDALMEVLPAFDEGKTRFLADWVQMVLRQNSGLGLSETCELMRNSMAAVGIPRDFASNLGGIIQSDNATVNYQILNQILKNACEQNGGWHPGVKTAVHTCNKFGFQPTVQGKKSLQSPEEFKRNLHQLFNRPLEKNSVVGIEYCGGVLKNPLQSFIKDRTFDENIDYLNTEKASRNFEPECSFHASAMIGRERKPDGKCYFLIQNSYGASCNYYKDPNMCEAGKVWVEENAISQNLVRISSF
jgi:hypothetical protein